MSTNYYWREFYTHEATNTNIWTEFHIGKYSYRYSFMFQGYYGYNKQNDKYTLSEMLPVEGVKSWKAYKEFLQTVPIFDEYNRFILYSDFVNIVEGYGSPSYTEDGIIQNNNHLIMIRNDPKYYDIHKEYNDISKHWIDDDGYCFSVNYFS